MLRQPDARPDDEQAQRRVQHEVHYVPGRTEFTLCQISHTKYSGKYGYYKVLNSSFYSTLIIKKFVYSIAYVSVKTISMHAEFFTPLFFSKVNA